MRKLLSIAAGRKSGCHPSRFEARRDVEPVNGPLMGFNCEFLGVEVFALTGKGLGL